MKLPTDSYEAQKARWPSSGQHILAQFDESTIIVYQAYRESIARYAIANQRFGGPDFSLGRMSWIKPNFLWMMYRSGWGTKEGQEFTLALRLRRTFFDSLLEAAVPSSYDPRLYTSSAEWSAAVARSEVRLQWDPDHTPSGAKTERRAIQIGLRGASLQALAGPELLEVVDLTTYVEAQRVLLQAGQQKRLVTPVEHVYAPSESARIRVATSIWDHDTNQSQ